MEIKLYYLILAHKNLSQVKRLISSLGHSHAKFFLHIDRKVGTSEIHEQSFGQMKNVVVVRPRINIHWGGFSMVQATLLLLKRASVEKQKGYYILLSGQDFPLKSSNQIFDFLATRYGNEYLEYFYLPSSNWGMSGGLDRINYYWFIDSIGKKESQYLYELQKNENHRRPFFDGLAPCGGSQWWCLTDECVAFILAFVGKYQIFHDYYRHCFIPDEMFFQTIILNSTFRDKVVNNNLRHIDWVSGPQHPKILQEIDLDSLIASDNLWARKFETNQSNMLDKLEEHMHSRQGDV